MSRISRRASTQACQLSGDAKTVICQYGITNDLCGTTSIFGVLMPIPKPAKLHLSFTQTTAEF